MSTARIGPLRLSLAGIVMVLIGTPRSILAGEMGSLPRDDGTGITVRIGGPATVPADRRVESLIVVGDDARIDGTVADALVVIGGKARIEGTVLGDVTVVRGQLTLGPTSRIGGDVSLLRSGLERMDGSAVRGAVHQGTSPWRNAPVRLILWLATSGAIVLTGLLFVLLAGETIEAAARTVVRDGPIAGVAAVAFWICAPLAVVVTTITIVGIPLALVMALFVLPVLWFAGYVSTGVAIGTLLARLWTARGRAIPRAAAMALGIATLQLALLIPLLGPGLAFVAGYLGTGALVCNAWRRRRGPGTTERPLGERLEPEAGAPAPVAGA